MIEIADNGLIALDKLTAADFDVVLMDIQMPEMDGFEATRKIRQDFPSPKHMTKIMAMTANVTKRRSRQLFSCGMDEYIAKPFDPQDLCKSCEIEEWVKGTRDEGRGTRDGRTEEWIN